MTEESKKKLAINLMRFPSNGGGAELITGKANSAIRLYGKRFYKDQTPVEYLAEFLLAFASPKQTSKEGCYQFKLSTNDDENAHYWPEDRIALKLFSFFSSSKLETRHSAHRQAYEAALENVKERIGGAKDQQEEALRRVLTLLVDWVEADRSEAAATAMVAGVADLHPDHNHMPIRSPAAWDHAA